jgi:hypothetical protein
MLTFLVILALIKLGIDQLKEDALPLEEFEDHWHNEQSH